MPVVASGLATVKAIAVGHDHSCALLANGSLRCWGDNFFGQLGDGTFTDRLSPVDVSGLSTATAISAGTHLTCAQLVNGALRCWGNNRTGQVGRGGGGITPAPVPQ